MKKNKQIGVRVTDKELRDIRKLVKLNNTTMSKFVLDCIFNNIQVSKPIEIKRLRPPTRLPKPTKEITALPQSIKADFLKEIHEVFHKKNIFVN